MLPINLHANLKMLRIGEQNAHPAALSNYD